MMIRLAYALLLVVSVALPAAAAEIEGVKIEDRVKLSDGAELMLNGAGVRHKLAFVKVYIGSLYLTQKTTDGNAVFDDPGAKRVSMYILANEVAASDFIASLNNSLAANLVPHELALIEKRLRDLNSMMSAVKILKKGSVVHVDYLPGKGTLFNINGEDKITIPGDDFFRDLLHIWIGDKPVDGRLRSAMLAGH